MSNSWEKEDKIHYKNSEVMQELESIVLKTISRIDILNKKAAAPPAAEQKQNADATNELAVATERLNKALGVAADDGQIEEGAPEEGVAVANEDKDAREFLGADVVSVFIRRANKEGANPALSEESITTLQSLIDGINAVPNEEQRGRLIKNLDRFIGLAGMRFSEFSLVEGAVDSHTVVIEDNQAHDQEVKEAAIEELRELVSLAVEKGNYKLAYNIERTIDEITEEEVACEL